MEKSEEKYRLLATNTMDTIWTTDQDFNITYVNDTIYTFLGYTAEEFAGLNPIKFTPPEGIKVIQEASGELIKRFNEGEISQITFEVQQIKKDGTILDVEISTNLLLDSKGQFIGFQGRSNDITKRKRKDKIQKILYNISNAVITSKNLKSFISLIKKELSNIIDTTNFYVALYDEESDTISLPFFSDEKDNISSLPAGKTLTNYVIKTKKPLLADKKTLHKLEQSGKVKSYGSESKVWLGIPLKVEGIVTGVLALQSYTNEDAYNEKDIEILEFIAHQISISIERKKAEQDLKEALEKANESDRLKSTFLATMSHELRTPLNAIIGFSDLIDDDLPIDKILEFTNTINSSGIHLLDIVNDLFDITLIDTGEIKIFKKETILQDIFNDVQDIIGIEQFKLDKNNLEIKLIVPPGLDNLTLKTDPSKLKQILINLLKNAIKFTNEGHVHYGFELESLNDKKTIKFFVQDTGIGIPEDKYDIIFNTFRQVEDSHSRVYGGTGIGLSICRKLVELFDGKIWIESEVGKGSSFYFTIPIQEDEGEVLPDEKDLAPKHNFENKLFLIVEDVESSYEYLKIILENNNAKTLWAKDGSESIKYCKENPSIDLILMDINLPVMNGYDACKEIRKFNKDIIIIAQTAYALEGDYEKAIKADCNDYLSKPIKKEELLDKIDAWLKA
ncbi:ATP-binding protein [Bacteroidota bacterium]